MLIDSVNGRLIYLPEYTNNLYVKIDIYNVIIKTDWHFK